MMRRKTGLGLLSGCIAGTAGVGVMASAGSVALLGQLTRYALTTGLSASLSFGLPILLVEGFGVEQRAAVAIGFAAAYLGNLFLLRGFVFRSTGGLRSDTLRYVIANGAFRLAEYGAFLVLSIAGLDYRLAVFLVLSVSATIKFLAYRRLFTRN